MPQDEEGLMAKDGGREDSLAFHGVCGVETLGEASVLPSPRWCLWENLQDQKSSQCRRTGMSPGLTPELSSP